MAILTASIGAVSSAMATTRSLSQSSREQATALQAVESVIEQMRSEVPTEVFLRFNGTPLDDPPLGASPGNQFAVPGLRALPDDADGFVGEILFPGDGVLLREDLPDAELGMARDLNADGVLDANDHAADYTILPVRVRVRWLGAGGEQALDIVYVISTR